MGNRLDNLGDYNIARDALKEAGGSWETLYNSIRDTEVAKVTPGLMMKGAFWGVAALSGVVGVFQLGKKAINYLKDRQEKIEREPELKKQFEQAVCNAAPACETETGGNNDGEETE